MYHGGGCRFIKSLPRVEYVPQARKRVPLARAAAMENESSLIRNALIRARARALNDNKQCIIDNLALRLLLPDISGVNVCKYEI